MKKRAAAMLILFLICAGLVKCIDIYVKYDMNVWDYIRYSLPLSAEERKYLADEQIIYGTDGDDAPFSYLSSRTGQSMGMFIDYFSQLSITLETDFKPLSYDDYHLSLALKKGDIEAAAMNKTDLNSNVFLFTQALYTERSKILVREESEFQTTQDVKNISIAVIAGSAEHHAANEFFTEYKNVELILTENFDESLYLFGMNEVDAIIADEAKLSYYLNSNIRDNRFRFLEGSVSEDDVSIAVSKDNEILFSALNKGILEIKKSGQYDHIHSKWFGSFIPEISNYSSGSLAANALIIIMGITFVFLMWNHTITGRVNSRTRELNESREELRTILNSLYEGIIVTGGEGNIQVCNRSALNLLNTEKDAVIDKKISGLEKLRPFLEHANEEAAFKIEGKYYLVSRRKIGGSDEKELIVIEDYTARYRYESLTRQEAKMIAVGELSAGLAHEIRNPLGIIKNYIFIIRSRLTGSVEKHAVNVIDNSVDRINGLIDNLLNFSRLSVGKETVTDVKQIITQIVALENKNLEKNDIGISLSFSIGEKRRIYLNQDILRLVMVNLINNSVDALNESGKQDKKIDIRVRLEKDMLYIDFEDNGKGIRKENLEDIFNPFYTTKENGTGLGLYIVGSEISNAGGTITADSEENTGTVFHITLPADKETENEK